MSQATGRRDKFLIFGAPDIREAEIEEVVDSLRRGWLGTGPKVERFENDFRAYKGAEHAVAVNSCTAALHLKILAAAARPGAEVITKALTFVATIDLSMHQGVKQVTKITPSSSLVTSAT